MTMARGDDILKENSIGQRVQNSSRFKSSKAEKSPTFQQLLQRDGSKWSRISLQKQKKNHDDKEVDLIHLNKKSVLAKVKEKAKKLKQSLSGKKQCEENQSRHPSTTRSSTFGANDKGEEDAEYRSTRTYESKHTPAVNKQALIPEKHPEKRNAEQGKDEHTSSSNSKTEAGSKNQVPSDASVVAADTNTKSQVTSTTDVSKVHELSESNSRSSLTVSMPENVKTKDDMKGESETSDKGVSVKEYLMQKFEPREDERSLSNVITETISPRRHKVRGAMSSFLKNEEPSATNSSDIDNNVNLNFKSKSLPASTNLNNNTGSKIASIKSSYSLPSTASKGSSNLNQTFRSTFASYQSHFLGSSSNHNLNLNRSTTSSGPNTKTASSESLTSPPSPTKTSSMLLGHTSSANETQASVSAVDQTRAPTRPATSVRRVPVSNRTRFPKHIESNTNRVPVQTDTNETQSSVSIGDQSRSPS